MKNLLLIMILISTTLYAKTSNENYVYYGYDDNVNLTFNKNYQVDENNNTVEAQKSSDMKLVVNGFYQKTYKDAKFKFDYFAEKFSKTSNASSSLLTLRGKYKYYYSRNLTITESLKLYIDGLNSSESENKYKNDLSFDYSDDSILKDYNFKAKYNLITKLNSESNNYNYFRNIITFGAHNEKNMLKPYGLNFTYQNNYYYNGTRKDNNFIFDFAFDSYDDDSFVYLNKIGYGIYKSNDDEYDYSAPFVEIIAIKSYKKLTFDMFFLMSFNNYTSNFTDSNSISKSRKDVNLSANFEVSYKVNKKRYYVFNVENLYNFSTVDNKEYSKNSYLVGLKYKF